MNAKTESASDKQELEVQVNSPARMISEAVQKGADLEKLKGLLDLQERWEANEARKAYHVAMTDFKANAPRIAKDKQVSFGAGKAAYSHASLANVCDKINPELSKYGLSVSWRTAQNGSISVSTRISHVKGHFEETTISAPADTSGSKNSIQAVGSTITYLQRYGLLSMLGLATSDQDDDGAGATVQYIDEKQLSGLLDFIASTKTDETKFLQYLGIDALEKMPKSLYPKALAALKAKRNRK